MHALQFGFPASISEIANEFGVQNMYILKNIPEKMFSNRN